MTNRLLAALCLLALPVLAGPLDSLPPRGSDADRASKSGQLAGEVGGAKYVVTYGRPKVKARKVWGGLVEGGKVWRAGADEATVFAFDSDVLVEGQKLPAGAYAFFTIPGKDPAKDPWTVIFNKQPKQWGAFKYDEKGDALKVKVTPKTADMVDELTYEQQGGAVVLRWEKLAVPVQIKKATP
jgi:hypothetical protein